MNEQEVRLELFNAIKNRLPIKYWENGTAEEVCEDLYKAIGYLEPYIPLVSLKSLEPKVDDKGLKKLCEASQDGTLKKAIETIQQIRVGNYTYVTDEVDNDLQAAIHALTELPKVQGQIKIMDMAISAWKVAWDKLEKEIAKLKNGSQFCRCEEQQKEIAKLRKALAIIKSRCGLYPDEIGELRILEDIAKSALDRKEE